MNGFKRKICSLFITFTLLITGFELSAARGGFGGGRGGSRRASVGGRSGSASHRPSRGVSRSATRVGAPRSGSRGTIRSGARPGGRPGTRHSAGRPAAGQRGTGGRTIRDTFGTGRRGTGRPGTGGRGTRIEDTFGTGGRGTGGRQGGRTIKDTFGTGERGTGRSGTGGRGTRIEDTFGTGGRGTDGRPGGRSGAGTRIEDTFGTGGGGRDGGWRNGGGWRDGGWRGNGWGIPPWAWGVGLGGLGIATLLGGGWAEPTYVEPTTVVSSPPVILQQEPVALADVGMAPQVEQTTNVYASASEPQKPEEEEPIEEPFNIDSPSNPFLPTRGSDVITAIGFGLTPEHEETPQVRANKIFSHKLTEILKHDPKTINALKVLLKNPDFNKKFSDTMTDPEALNKLTRDLNEPAVREKLKEAAGIK